MTDPDPPSRGTAIGFVALGLLFLGLVPVVIQVNGMPTGYGFFEVILLPIVVGLGFSGRGLFLLWKRRAR